MIGFFAAGAMGSGGDGPPPLPVVTWSPTDKNDQVLLDNGLLTATRAAAPVNAYASVRATLAKSSGKHYFEVRLDSASSGPYGLIGVATPAAPLVQGIGANQEGWAYYQQTGQKHNQGVLAEFGAAYSTGDVIGVAVNVDTGSVWFSKNGEWQAGGSPASGASPAFTGVPVGVLPAVSLYTGTTAPRHQVTGRFRPSDFSYPAPEGFAPWGGE